MTSFEETFFYRLWVNCDDYGRMDARTTILKAKLFPLKDRLTLKDVQGALTKLVDIGCVELYEVEQKPYLYLPTWTVHQRVRNLREKYPSPDNADILPRVAADCGEFQQDAARAGAESNPIQSESNPNPIHIPDLCKEIIEYLNEKVGKAFKHTSKANQDLIKARLNDKYTLDDFKKVIDNKVAEWNHEPEPEKEDMRNFLRPETLFATKHFESYLNSKPPTIAIPRRNNFIQRQYDDEFYEMLDNASLTGKKG
jgi:uncharacterized phage protein (TIGR02220 family)